MACKEVILREYELKDIVSSGKVLGIGTYCCVAEALLGETVCVAKTMHPELVDFNVGVDAFIESAESSVNYSIQILLRLSACTGLLEVGTMIKWRLHG